MRVPLVVLDTTVLRADWHLVGNMAVAVLGESESGRIDLCVPEVCIQEAVRGWRSEYRKTIKGATKLNQLLNNKVTIDLAEPDVASMGYEQQLRAALKRSGVETLPYPSVSHRDVVGRSLEGRKPFDGEGRRGYRDALIWASVLERLERNGSDPCELVLITHNSGDFCDQDTARLHPELEADVVRTCPGASAVVHADMREFVQAYVTPVRELVTRLQGRLDSDLQFLAETSALLTETACETHAGHVADQLSESVPLPVRDLYFWYVDGHVEAPTVVDAWRVGQGEIVVTLVADCDGVFAGAANVSDYVLLPESRRPRVFERDGETLKIETSERVTVMFDALVGDQGNGELSSVEFVAVYPADERDG